MDTSDQLDVIIIGGSNAGLSAALTLGRSLRNVLVIDGGKPCNRQTPHSHNFLTQDGETPAHIATIAKEQILRYPSVTFLTDLATEARQESDGFIVETANGHSFRSRKVLLATGIEDIMPSINGFAECWGRSVLHCPYCHGYEVHGQRLGILANGETAYELARLIQHWSPDLTVFTNGPATLTNDQSEVISQLGIPVVTAEIAEIEHQSGQLERLRFTDGSTHELDAIFSRVPFRQHTTLAQQLGCLAAESGLIKADEFGETNIPGVYVAGDNSSPMRQVAAAIASGSKAAAMLNRQLIAEELSARLVKADAVQ
ncbi:NAD(P)/FAD-dependent oxidoreductase [Spirosoma oryzicola]|uniref:NAD(P)/FAD-dependent oxidoreductase n=1 Tax=Spirosoma oryzicola TaxID=2898794 RepID=UPI001E5C0F28|nr:NAD(P)/FAD-dependent oxidoreductase [Spirosoma oryzicola]UHG89889.1 NAD(P)/FAD-dependent oxidoreductase [Spirosoma oryzicola]